MIEQKVLLTSGSKTGNVSVFPRQLKHQRERIAITERK
jgi:hypothetical protein